MDIKILWVSEKQVDYDAIECTFPLFRKKFEGFAQEPPIIKRQDDGVFRMPAKAGTIRICARNNEHQSPDDYFIHVRDIRQTAAELECSVVVLDHESAPWPLVSWLVLHDASIDNAECNYLHDHDGNIDYDKPKYIPVFVYWKGKLYFVSNLELMED